jgi:hypothetical protein
MKKKEMEERGRNLRVKRYDAWLDGNGKRTMKLPLEEGAHGCRTPQREGGKIQRRHDVTSEDQKGRNHGQRTQTKFQHFCRNAYSRVIKGRLDEVPWHFARD